MNRSDYRLCDYHDHALVYHAPDIDCPLCESEDTLAHHDTIVMEFQREIEQLRAEIQVQHMVQQTLREALNGM